MRKSLTEGQWKRCQRFLIGEARKHFAAWLPTKNGKRYHTSKRRYKSPSMFGYAQPPWMHDLRNAMGLDDAEDALGIMHAVMAGRLPRHA